MAYSSAATGALLNSIPLIGAFVKKNNFIPNENTSYIFFTADSAGYFWTGLLDPSQKQVRTYIPLGG
jgi:hypothetical protein